MIKFLRIEHLGDIFDVTEFSADNGIAYSVPVVTIQSSLLTRVPTQGSVVISTEDGDIHINSEKAIWISGGMAGGWVCMRYSIPSLDELICVPVAVIEYIVHVGDNELSNVTAKNMSIKQKFVPAIALNPNGDTYDYAHLSV